MSILRKTKSQKGREVKSYLTKGSKSVILKHIKKSANKARRLESRLLSFTYA